ncbi:hypothetical protein DMENIID0001_147240 [Sergentomyia squamirostris]
MAGLRSILTDSLIPPLDMEVMIFNELPDRDIPNSPHYQVYINKILAGDVKISRKRPHEPEEDARAVAVSPRVTMTK